VAKRKAPATKQKRPAFVAARLLAFLEQPAPADGPDGTPPRIARVPLGLRPQQLRRVTTVLAKRNLLAPETLASRALAGLDLEAEAETLNLTPLETAALYETAVLALDPRVRADIEAAIAHPKGLGQLDPRDPIQERIRKNLGVDKIAKVSPAVLKEWKRGWDLFPIWRGPIAAVDHRPFLGPARDQGGRPTCTAFGSTVAAEAMEFFRDSLAGPRDLSEELMFWYSKGGQIFTAGGYDCGAALRHYTEYGSCEEGFFPYWGVEISSNHAQVPAPDEAMDRAQFFLSDSIVTLPNDNVQPAKDALRAGKCVVIGSDVDTWDNGTGTIVFPTPITRARGAQHCTALIGYIDRDDLPAVHEGGYFIVRNSWGGDGSTANLLGPEYGGHLLMPYGWYRRYVWCSYAFVDREATAPRDWIVELYANPSLRGTPISTQRSPDVDFDWGTDSPYEYEFGFPFSFEVDLIPEDHFSARFTQLHRFREGWHRFRLRGDDGVRLWVDDRLVINAWWDQARTEYVAEHYVAAGDHVLRVEYYENTGAASVRLQIEPVNFHYQVWTNDAMTGSPAATFDDTLTKLEWRHAPPVSTTTSKGVFSLRATGTNRFEAGDYVFHARHTGGCRISVDGTVVLDAWAGPLSAASAPVTLSAGNHAVRVEYKNLATIPAPGVKGYYRAALEFDWADVGWRASFYHDDARKAVSDAGWPNVDSAYEAFRTGGLTGHPVFEGVYPANHSVANEYFAQDAVPLRLSFGDLKKFQTGIPGAAAIPADPGDWLGAHIRRRIFVDTAGRYEFTLRSDDGYRLIVDGKQLLQDEHVIDSDPYTAEVELGWGVHDLAIEYENLAWGGVLDFSMNHAAWTVEYFTGTDFNELAGTRTLDRIERVVADRPPAVGAANWSARARRTLWLPLGRYRIAVRADDGVRLRVGGVPVVDAWTDQPPTSYVAHVEHRGGSLPIELEYYQRWGGADLALELAPDGFLGEYYRGTQLERPEPGSPLDRNVPIAYRFEPRIDFDWGRGGRLPRIGADRFSARWTGQVELPVGRWEVSVTSDDGVRVFMDGRLLVDRWIDQAATTESVVVDLAGRRHDLKVEYYEKTADAVCRLALRRVFPS